ncbi:beta-N-acetylglucosaminidase domain-containing protein [Mesomycoplasma molare]|uniref:Protein O-GlcNAcase n=1 Tax=Mesomycoplasma molare TaxID=171288 RepID=A0ABY5TWU1_9BACT|nr:beta-N-acetylglucosaminidase domain-containing protein [Mesomycoplasma molare]UWD34456.1 protein O-GlcNAcase [Mesomycoplasma molare]
MKNKNKNFIRHLLLTSPIVISPFSFLSMSNEANNSVQNIDYQFLTPVKNISYDNNFFILKNKINLILSSPLEDNPNFILLIKTLKELKYEISFSETTKSDYTNIVISFLEDKNLSVNNLITKYGLDFNYNIANFNEYFIELKNNYLFLESNDKIGLTNGLATLKEIIKNSDNKVLQNAKINDYQKIKNRSIFDSLDISLENRKKNISNAITNGFNKYIYFNSRDLKNSKNWRDLYDEYELNLLNNLANFTKEKGMEFIYTIDFFTHSSISQDNYFESDIDVLKQKLLQLINNGIKSFAFSSLESSNLNNTLQVNVINSISEWLSSLRDSHKVNEKIFYLVKEQNVSLIPDYFSTFNNNIEIIMTGGKKYNNLNSEFIRTFNSSLNKKANIIFNFPKLVDENILSIDLLSNFDFNDFQHNDLNSFIVSLSENLEINNVFLKEFNILFSLQNRDDLEKQKNILLKNILNLNSIENPLLKSFNNVLDNINYSDKEESEIINLNESNYLSSSLTEIENKIKNNNYTIDEILDLKKKISILQNDSEFILNYKNNFTQEIKPWVQKIFLISEIINILLDVAVYKRNNLLSETNNSIFLAEEKLRHIENIADLKENKKINGGEKVLLPFIKSILTYFKNNIAISVEKNIFEVEQEFISSRGREANSSFGVSSEQVLLKSNNSVSVFNGYNEKIRKDEYFGTRFSEAITLNKVYIKMGDGTDHFYNFVVEYQLEDDTNWNQIGSAHSAPSGNFNPITLTNLNLKNVKAVRVRNLEENSDNGWVRIFNFVVNDFDKEKIVETWFNDAVFNANDSLNIQNRAGNSNSILDDDIRTEWQISSRNTHSFNQGASVSISFPTRRNITRVLVEQGASKHSDVLNNFKVEYYDYGSNEWKRFGSYDLENLRSQTISGFAYTDKIRIINNSQKNSWWRLGTFKAGGFQVHENQTFVLKSPNLRIAQNGAINSASRNDRFEYIVDKNDDTYAWMSQLSNNGNIAQNNYLNILFNDYKEITSIRILQQQNEVLRYFKIQKIINDNYVDISPEIDVNNNLEFIYEVPKNTGKMNGIRIISTRNSNRWWGLKSVDISDKKAKNKENLYLSSETKSEEFSTLEDELVFSLTNQNNEINKNYTLSENEYIGINLGKILKIKEVTTNITKTDQIKFFSSINGVEWKEVDDINSLGEDFKAQYFIVKNISSQNVNIAFTNLIVKTEENLDFGKLDSTNFAKNENYDSKFEFDNDLSTSSTFSQVGKNKYVIYDLIRKQTINSIKIYSSEDSYDFPRDIEVQVSEDKDIWHKAFTINDNNSGNNLSKLKDTTYGFFSRDKVNYRYWGKENLNFNNIKYIRILVKNNYPLNRNLSINEIIINDQESPLKETNFKYEGSELTSSNTNGPEKLLDKNLKTTFIPNQNSGILKINIDSKEFKGKKIRIFSSKVNLNTKLKLKTFNKENSTENEIFIGNLSKNLIFFNLPNNQNEELLQLIIEWKNEKPIINEISLENIEGNNDVSREEVNLLLENLPSNFDNWINEDKTAFNKIKSSILLALESEYLSQKSIEDFKNEINFIIQNSNVKADTNNLKELIQNKVTNENDIYTLDSYTDYDTQIKNAKKFLSDEENLTQEKINTLTEKINTSFAKLKFSRKQKVLLDKNINLFNELNKNIYEAIGINVLKVLVDEGKEKLNISEDALLFLDLNNSFNFKYNNLKLNELGIKLKELESLVKKAKIIIEDKKWETIDNNLSLKIFEIDDFISKNNFSQNSILSYSESLEKELNNFQSIKSAKINEFKENIINKYITIKDFLIPETYINYQRTIKDGENSLNSNELSDKIIVNNIKLIKESEKNIEINRDYLLEQLHNIEDKNIVNVFLNKLEIAKENKLDYLNLILEFQKFNTPVNIAKISTYKEELNQLLQKITNEMLKEKFINEINNSYKEEDLQLLKVEVEKEIEKESSNEEKMNNKNNNVGIILGSTFSILALLSAGIFVLYKRFFKKTKDK